MTINYQNLEASRFSGALHTALRTIAAELADLYCMDYEASVVPLQQLGVLDENVEPISDTLDTLRMPEVCAAADEMLGVIEGLDLDPVERIRVNVQSTRQEIADEISRMMDQHRRGLDRLLKSKRLRIPEQRLKKGDLIIAFYHNGKMITGEEMGDGWKWRKSANTVLRIRGEIDVRNADELSELDEPVVAVFEFERPERGDDGHLNFSVTLKNFFPADRGKWRNKLIPPVYKAHVSDEKMQSIQRYDKLQELLGQASTEVIVQEGDMILATREGMSRVVNPTDMVGRRKLQIREGVIGDMPNVVVTNQGAIDWKEGDKCMIKITRITAGRVEGEIIDIIDPKHERKLFGRDGKEYGYRRREAERNQAIEKDLVKAQGPEADIKVGTKIIVRLTAEGEVTEVYGRNQRRTDQSYGHRYRVAPVFTRSWAGGVRYSEEGLYLAKVTNIEGVVSGPYAMKAGVMLIAPADQTICEAKGYSNEDPVLKELQPPKYLMEEGEVIVVALKKDGSPRFTKDHKPYAKYINEKPRQIRYIWFDGEPDLNGSKETHALARVQQIGNGRSGLTACLELLKTIGKQQVTELGYKI